MLNMMDRQTKGLQMKKRTPPYFGMDGVGILISRFLLVVVFIAFQSWIPISLPDIYIYMDLIL
jgi:hypothetical protein